MSDFGRVEAEQIVLLEVMIVKALVEHPDGHRFVDVKGFQFDMSYASSINLAEKLVKAELYIQVGTDSEQTEEAKGEFRLAFIYKINNLQDLTKTTEEEQILVSGELDFTLASISYSTARGILLTRFQGTVFRDFILPVINPNQLLTQQTPRSYQ